MAGLTPKQEAFCQAYIETGNASEAYRTAYAADKMKPESINRKAKELLDNGKIAARVKDIRGEHRKRHNITVDDLLCELEEARKAALGAENPQSSAAVAATMGKARLVGLTDGSIGVSIQELELQKRRLEVEKLRKEISSGNDDLPITRMEVVIVGKDDKDDTDAATG